MKYLLRLLTFLRPYKKRIVATYVVLLISTLLSLALPRLLGNAIDRIQEQGELSYLILVAVGVLGFSLAYGIFLYFQRYLAEAISYRVAYDLRNSLYNHLQYLSFSYYDKQQTGQLMSRATADIEGVRMFVSFGIIRLVYMIVLFLAISILLLTTSWKMGLITLAAVPLVSIRATYVRRRLRALWRDIQEITGQMGAAVQENLSGARVVRAFSREEYEIDKFSYRAQDLADKVVHAERVHASNSPLMNFIFAMIMGAILWVGGREVIQGNITSGELTQFIFYLMMLAQPVRVVGWVINLFARAASSGERIFQILDTQSAIQERPRAATLQDVKGHVEFHKVNFTYDSGGPTLSDIDFDVQPGQVVALLGSTGSGKSTVVHLIPRFYDITGGSITIDDKDVRDITIKSLRRSIGIVQQDVFLFSDTVKNNIAYGAFNASMEEIERAVEAARLTDFINSLSQGYDTWVGERGITLSGGQKQRVAIARTLLMNPPILIMDDSTASVDTETEMLIQEALKELIKGRTTFIIAQRMSTVRNADLILVLEEGRIVERGTHTQLLQDGGIYREIYELQLKPQNVLVEAGAEPSLTDS